MYTNKNELKDLLQAAIEAAKIASNLILSVYEKVDLFVTEKNDKSPLTDADLLSHEIITKSLSSFNLPILSEESAKVDYDIRKNWREFWLIDPLDGTKEFLKRNGEFTVNIALISNQNPILGVVCKPIDGTIYFASHKKGAWKIDQNNKKIKLPFNTDLFNINKRGIRVVASRSHRDTLTENYINSLIEPEVVSMGSSLKFMLISEKKADVYPRFAPTMEWDTAAAHCIINETGHSILSYYSNLPLVYNKVNLLNPHLIAF